MAISSPTSASIAGLKLGDGDPLRLIARLRAGLPGRTLAALKRESGLPDNELAQLLQLSERTFSRLKSAPPARLSPDVSERVYGVAALYAQAAAVLGDAEVARQWMRAPQFAFAQQAPQSLLSSEIGREQVRLLLRRLEHGLLA